MSAPEEIKDELVAASTMPASERPTAAEDTRGSSDHDAESSVCKQPAWPLPDSDRLRKDKSLIRGYLYTSDSVGNSNQDTKYLGPLHIRRTLDQSHYFMLMSTAYRDRHQVVLKEARRRVAKPAPRPDDLTSLLTATTRVSGLDDEEDVEPVQDDSESYPMVMVDQLWLLVIGTTVITNFPQSWTRDDGKRDGDILERILHHLKTEKRRALIREPQDLVDMIVSYCAGVFNRPRSALGLTLHDHFETSVGRAADKETKFFRNFEDASAMDPTELMKTEGGKKKLERLFNIVPEVKLLDETKDNVDELRMILRVLNDQALVMTDMNSILQKHNQPQSNNLTQSPQRLNAEISPHNITTTFTEGSAEGPMRSETISVAYRNRHPIIDANIRDFDRMLSHANANYDALNHLLDLKQKHATVTEARFAGNRADETARQGNTIMFFTVVTIIFGSTSFVISFFALNITAFPKNGDGDTAWDLGRIVGLVAGVSVGLALPLVLIAFMINPIKEYLDKRRRPDRRSGLRFGFRIRRWWHHFTAKSERQSDHWLHEMETEHERRVHSTIARTGQKFAYVAIGAGVPEDQYINEAEAKDSALASVNEASHQVEYDNLTR
jgi:hypothetical protein